MSLILHLHSSVLCRTSASVHFPPQRPRQSRICQVQSIPRPHDDKAGPCSWYSSQFSRCLAGQSVSGSPRSSTVMTDSLLSKRALFLLFRFWMIRKSMPLQRGVTDLFLLGTSSRAFLILLAFYHLNSNLWFIPPHIHALCFCCWATYTLPSLQSHLNPTPRPLVY